MKAIRIKMKENTKFSNNPKQVEGIYIDNGSEQIFYSVDEIYKLLTNEPATVIYVGDDTSAYLVPITATNGKGYIRSVPNTGMIDLIMRLPRDNS